MNQTAIDLAMKNMRSYVALAEEEIAERKTQCQKLQDELDSSRRLMESLQQKLREAEAIVKRQQNEKRVSQFKMDKIESGGTIQLSMAIGDSSVVVGGGMKSQHCERKGCCGLERLYLCDGGYEEVQTECYAFRLRHNVVLQKT
jgi:predicted RNase H-like nuclease (RuvC/YqgF family)